MFELLLFAKLIHFEEARGPWSGSLSGSTCGILLDGCMREKQLKKSTQFAQILSNNFYSNRRQTIATSGFKARQTGNLS